MNFIHSSLPETDRELFFGPLDTGEQFLVFDQDHSMANMAVMIGAFPSTSQARKNGWARPVPPGFSEHKIGKRRFWILNRFDGCDE